MSCQWAPTGRQYLLAATTTTSPSTRPGRVGQVLVNLGMHIPHRGQEGARCTVLSVRPHSPHTARLPRKGQRLALLRARQVHVDGLQNALVPHCDNGMRGRGQRTRSQSNKN
eukprot:COSAG01_NODE_4445_length_5016_cov_92.960545_4_plen_112_part_00